MTKNYAEKLRDPRWQKKRLEVLQRDNWTCQLCGETKETLMVHHRYYLPNHEPWDYPDEALATLCETCHESVTLAMGQVQFNLDTIRRHLWPDDLANLAAAIALHGPLDYEDLSLTQACWVLEHPELFHDMNEALRQAGLFG